MVLGLWTCYQHFRTYQHIPIWRNPRERPVFSSVSLLSVWFDLSFCLFFSLANDGRWRISVGNIQREQWYNKQMQQVSCIPKIVRLKRNNLCSFHIYFMLFRSRMFWISQVPRIKSIFLWLSVEYEMYSYCELEITSVFIINEWSSDDVLLMIWCT